MPVGRYMSGRKPAPFPGRANAGEEFTPAVYNAVLFSHGVSFRIQLPSGRKRPPQQDLM